MPVSHGLGNAWQCYVYLLCLQPLGELSASQVCVSLLEGNLDGVTSRIPSRAQLFSVLGTQAAHDGEDLLERRFLPCIPNADLFDL